MISYFHIKYLTSINSESFIKSLNKFVPKFRIDILKGVLGPFKTLMNN